MIKTDTDISKLPRVLQRFLHYISFDTRSDGACASSPSTPGQRALAEALCEELKSLGVADVHVTEHGIVTRRTHGIFCRPLSQN